MEKGSIALDGPSGAGKSTLAKRLAEHLKLIYVDTGALYRSVALFALNRNMDTKDDIGLAAILPQIKIEMEYDSSGMQRMYLGGEDVTDSIRTPQVSMGASDVSAMPAVREFLLSMQKDMAAKYDVIMDGRDIGTVVLPDAGLKIFLTASPEIRAKRRHLELVEKNIETTYEEVYRDIVQRDRNDTLRQHSPLMPAKDSVLLDTTDLDLEESFAALLSIITQWKQST